VSENGGTSTGTSFIWRGEYVPGTKYEVNDLVFYQGSTYICKITNAIAAPTQASFWEIFARGVLYRGEFVASSTTSYAVNDIVTYNGSAYICKTAVAMASETPDVSSSWGLLSEKGADGKSAYKYAQDAGYTGTEAEFSAKLAENIEVPTKLSDLTADSTHRLVTDTEKSAWNAKANTSDIPTKVSQLTNDSGYLTSAPVTKVNNKTGAVTLTASDVSAVPTSRTVNGKALSSNITLGATDVGADASGTANSAVTAHNTNTSAHADIREQISQLSSEKVDKNNLTLGLHTDGLFYIFVDGAPIGNGIALPTGSVGDVVGNIDSDNNIILTGDIPDGNYAVKYKMSDGTLVDIGDLVKSNSTTSYTNFADPTSADWQPNMRLNSSGVLQTSTGALVTNYISCKKGDTIEVKGLTLDATIPEGKHASIFVYHGDVTTPSETIYTSDATHVDTYGITFANGITKFTLWNANTTKIRLQGTPVSGEEVVITVNESISGGGGGSVTPSYTNQIPLSINADGTPFVGTNGEKGYKTGFRISRSGGGESAQEGTECTGFIPVPNGYNSTIRIKNIAYEGDDTRCVVGYDANFTKVNTGANAPTLNEMFNGSWTVAEDNGVRAITITGFTHFYTDTLKYIRLCSTDINENSIITINQKIV
jgi:hypothetical protein